MPQSRLYGCLEDLEVESYILLHNSSIGDNTTIANTEIENSIIMEGAYIDCGRRITDSLIGRKVRILNNETSLPRDHKLIIGDQSTIIL